MPVDKLFLHVLWRETSTRLEVLQGRVNEGVDVDAASEFARWLRFTGLLKLLEQAPDDERLPVKGHELSKRVDKLVADCGDWYAKYERSNIKPPAQIPRSELEAINAQLAELRATIAKLSLPTLDTAQAGLPALRVIEGGVS